MIRRALVGRRFLTTLPVISIGTRSDRQRHRRSKLFRMERPGLLKSLCVLLLATVGGKSYSLQSHAGTNNQRAGITEANSLFQAGTAAFEAGDIKTAKAKFARLIRIAPNVAAAHSAYGVVLLTEGDTKAAIA